MIKSLNRLSLLTAFPGFLLQLYGIARDSAAAWPRQPEAGIGPTVFLVAGTLLVMVGLALGARAKGRAIWWALIGVAPILGIWIGAAVINSLRDQARPRD